MSSTPFQDHCTITQTTCIVSNYILGSQVTLTLFPVRVVPVMSSLLMLRLKSVGTPVRAHRWMGVGRMHNCSGKDDLLYRGRVPADGLLIILDITLWDDPLQYRMDLCIVSHVLTNVMQFSHISLDYIPLVPLKYFIPTCAYIYLFL